MGSQALTPEQFREMLLEVSRIAAAVGRQCSMSGYAVLGPPGTFTPRMLRGITGVDIRA